MKIEKGTLLKIGIAIFVLYLAINHWPDVTGVIGTIFAAALPLLIGCIIAYPLNILMSLYERLWFPKTKKKALILLRRPICLAGAILSMLAIVALVIVIIVPQLTDCVMLLVNEVPKYINQVIDWIAQFEIVPDDIIKLLDSFDWRSYIKEAFNFLEKLGTGFTSVMGTVVKMVSSIFSGTVTAVLAIIFALYLLAGRDTLKKQFTRLIRHYVKPTWCAKFFYVLRIVDDSFRKFIVGQCTEAVILGGLCTVGMLIFRFPYATMIGALIAFTALIPIAGAYIGAGVGAFMILTVSPMKALLFLVFIVILQQLEGNIIYPRVVGSSIGLPGIWVLVAVTVGGGILGVAGMLLGVPLCAAFYRILSDDLKKPKKHPIQPEKTTE